MPPDFTIPTDLIELVRQRRVIPFVGAGFSAQLGAPNWDSLLREIAAEVACDLSYDQIKNYCNADNLQIAEYFFLKCDRSIGPLRHQIEKLMRIENPTRSTAHVELVNLNAPQIYTTNYDEAIESTFQKLGHPYSVVALPKHVANSGRDKTQVVKFHGDLRYDNTLILTESSYYSRLDFESPMDLKFRSDLLGRSVLFMGYSFRDINIRIIWFKLMEMMRDVPEQDRPSSFIIRFEPNPVLEELYRAVGIRTVYLDPAGHALTDDDRSKLLGRFLCALSSRVASGGSMPESTTRMYLSIGILDEIQSLVAASRGRGSGRRTSPMTELHGLVRVAEGRQVPIDLVPDVDRALEALAYTPQGWMAARWAVGQLETAGAFKGAVLIVLRAITVSAGREAVLNSVPWPAIWSTRIDRQIAEIMIRTLRAEAAQHREGFLDEDLAYAADVVKRIAIGQLAVDDSDVIKGEADAALADAAKIYSAIDDLSPDPTAGPHVAQLVAQIKRAAEEEEFEILEKDDVQF